MHAMSGMSSTFSASTRVTLWFADWTTTSTAAYALAIFFLFSLGMCNRFLGALRSQLERKWKDQREVDASSRSKQEKMMQDNSSGRRHARQWSLALRTQPVRLQHAEEHESEPLSPAIQTHRGDETGARKPAQRTFWLPNAPWSVKRDGISALLEFTRALIGYVLMLAVMTYNIGFLFAVTGSVLLGELVFGRYTRGSAGLAEDGCHA
ncbi:hypothetical protein ACN47E_009524 [Coniothyrium glycines]